MKIGSRRIIRTDLLRGRSLTITDGEATTVRIHRGCVWITEDGSFVDHVLTAGQRYTFDRPGLAIVSAHTDARITLVTARGPGPARVASAGATLYARPRWQSVLSTLRPWPIRA